jgi:type IV secretory pathway VirB2 component (pilin)
MRGLVSKRHAFALARFFCTNPTHERWTSAASCPGEPDVPWQVVALVGGAVVLYVLALVAVVVGVDVLFFRNRFWERLMVDIGIVLVFAAFGLRFLKRP